MNALDFVIAAWACDYDGWGYIPLTPSPTVNYYEPMMTRKHRIKRQKNKRKRGAK